MFQGVAVLLSGATQRLLWGELQLTEDFPNMARMIFDVELSLDDFGEAFSGPQLGREACGLRTAQDDLHECFPLPFGKFRRPSRGRFVSQAVEPLTPHCLFPAFDGRRRNIQRPNDLGVFFARKKKPPSSQTASLLLQSAS